jgi:hypothetical protein
MPKEFYTERDIEDLFQRGIRSLQVTGNVVLTELAYEKANGLGVQLITDQADNPPAAPVRPYIAEQQVSRPVPTIGPASSSVEPLPGSAIARAPDKPRDTKERSNLSASAVEAQKSDDVEQRIRSAVIARLGNQVDAKLLDNIIHRVVKSVGLK